MRVLSLTTIYPNEQNSAEGRSVASLDRALAAQTICGTTLVLKPYAPYWPASRVQKWKHLAVRAREQNEKGARVFFSHYLHLPTRYSLTQCVASMTQHAIQLIEQHNLKFDLVHGQSIYPAALAAQRVAARFHVPYVITLRDDLSHLEYMYQHRAGGRELFAPMFANTAAIFVHGPALKRDAPNFLPKDSQTPLVLAPNGVDVAGLEAQLERVPPPPRGDSSIVSVGSLMRFKGYHENLNALKLLDERGLRKWNYTIVGEGRFDAVLKQMTHDLNLQDRVKFLGYLPHRQALAEIVNADIFSLPSWSEPFGNVYGEAAVCERPAIGCEENGAEMIIEHPRTGLLVPPKNVEALADALEYLLTHLNEARAMGKAARARVNALTWDATATRYAETFAKISRQPHVPQK